MRRLGALLAVAVVAGFAFSQPALADREPASVSVLGVVSQGDILSVSVSVADDDQQPIEGLLTADFRVEIGEHPAVVEAALTGEDDSVPLGLVLVVDTSGSMAGQPLESAKAALTQFASSVRPIDRLALITFDDAVEQVVPSTLDRALLGQEIQALEAGGNTALYDAVSEAVAVASATPEARRAIVFLADGEDFGGVSETARDRAIEAAAASGIPFYVVGLGQEIDTAFLQTLTAGGGRYLPASSPEDLVELYGDISASLRLQYTLRVRIPSGVVAGEVPVAVMVGEASGSGRMLIAPPVTPSQPTFAVLPEELNAAAVVGLNGVAGQATVEWRLDGTLVESTVPEIRLDPYVLAPGQHSLVALITVVGQATQLQADFTVPSLPPRLVSPIDLPPLRAGDVLLLTVESQQAPVTVRYLIDGVVSQVGDAPPYRFVVPGVSGDATVELTIELRDATGSAAYSFTVDPPGPAGRSWALVAGGLFATALLAAGVAAIGWFGVRPWLQRRQEREQAPQFDGTGPAFERWASERQAAPTGQHVAATNGPPGTAAPGAWGRIAVLSGPDRGTEFQLKDEAELAGRGRFCSIRLRDRAVRPAHVLFNRDRTYQVSSPGAGVEVDGATAPSGALHDGARIRIGSTLLQFTEQML